MKMKPVLGEVCGEVNGILVAGNEGSNVDCDLGIWTGWNTV
jgi:hypothetical protein